MPLRSIPAPMLLVILLTAWACLRPPPGGRDEPATLTVSAASDLTDALQEVGRLFEGLTGIHITFNFGSTGQLTQQIEQGAPVDLFLAANVRYVDELESQGLVLSGTKKIYARGQIILWFRRDAPLRITRITDLGREEVRRVAIANPDHAPYGVAAREALVSSGMWEEIQPKLVLAENVRQALQYAETGNVDVAVVALSLSRQSDGIWVPVPEELHRPIQQALAVIRATRHEGAARQFVSFVTGPEGRRIMTEYGFVLPGEEQVR
ncbi:MAG: molybdate ABC transporter substrate-binding protein [Acidobacteriota bacterium]